VHLPSRGLDPVDFTQKYSEEKQVEVVDVVSSLFLVLFEVISSIQKMMGRIQLH